MLAGKMGSPQKNRGIPLEALAGRSGGEGSVHLGTGEAQGVLLSRCDPSPSGRCERELEAGETGTLARARRLSSSALPGGLGRAGPSAFPRSPGRSLSWHRAQE